MSSAVNTTTYSNNPKVSCAVHLVLREQRKEIAISVLEKTKKVSHVALEYGTIKQVFFCKI